MSAWVRIPHLRPATPAPLRVPLRRYAAGVNPGRKPYARAIVLSSGAGVVGLAGAVAAGLGFDSFAFAWVLHFLLMLWMSTALDVLQPRLVGPWFRIHFWEPRLYQRLGAWHFMRVLRALGWERVMRGGRAFDGTRSSLAGLDRDTRTSEFGHLVLAALVAVLVVVAAALRAWSAVAWLSVLNVLLHGYPVLLQRAMRARVERIQRRSFATLSSR
jgi:hypothetical protein